MNKEQEKEAKEEIRDLKNLVRNQWFAFYRWFAGLSIFIIAISFTILSFSRIDHHFYNLLPFSLMLLFLGINIILSIRTISKGLDFYHIRWKTLESEIIPKKVKFNNKSEENDKQFKKAQRIIKRTFWVGLILFVIYMCVSLVLLLDC